MPRFPLSLLPFLAPALSAAQGPAAAIDTAIQRMGGLEVVQGVQRVRFEHLTLWHRQSLEQRPFADAVSSYERVSDLRDYTVPAWRNTRRPVSAAPSAMEIVDLVRDSVAARFMPTGPSAPPAWGPLNITYVDERRELFTFAPERLLLAARRAPDLRGLPDTTIGYGTYVRLAATIDRYPTTLFLRRADGFLAMARYRADHPNDFGLAPFGAMEVETWYGQWRPFPSSGAGTPPITYPTEWSIARLGVPYKRITVLNARFDAPVAPDSFAVADDLRLKYLSGPAVRPMWDTPLDSGRIIDTDFAVLGPPGFSPGAVRVGGRWILLEGSSVPQRSAAEDAWLRTRGPHGLAALLITLPGPTRGNIGWFVDQRLPVYLGAGAERGAAIVLSNWKVRGKVLPVTRGRWLRSGSDSLWVEPFDVPGADRGLVAWVPSLKWVYHALALDPVVRARILSLARERGWAVERLGHGRTPVTPLAAADRR